MTGADDDAVRMKFECRADQSAYPRSTGLMQGPVIIIGSQIIVERLYRLSAHFELIDLARPLFVDTLHWFPSPLAFSSLPSFFSSPLIYILID